MSRKQPLKKSCFHTSSTIGITYKHKSNSHNCSYKGVFTYLNLTTIKNDPVGLRANDASTLYNVLRKCIYKHWFLTNVKETLLRSRFVVDLLGCFLPSSKNQMVGSFSGGNQ